MEKGKTDFEEEAEVVEGIQGYSGNNNFSYYKRIEEYKDGKQERKGVPPECNNLSLS